MWYNSSMNKNKNFSLPITVDLAQLDVFAQAVEDALDNATSDEWIADLMLARSKLAALRAQASEASAS